MKIKIDTQNYVIAFLQAGSADGFIEVASALPNDFYFGGYKYVNGQFVATGDPRPTVPDPSQALPLHSTEERLDRMEKILGIV